MPDAPSGQQTEQIDGFEAAINRMRDTSKWLITALAAVGAALLAGLSLTSIGHADGSRLAWAIIGFGTAITGVLTACIAAAWLLGSGQYVSFDDFVGSDAFADARVRLGANTGITNAIPGTDPPDPFQRLQVQFQAAQTATATAQAAYETSPTPALELALDLAAAVSDDKADLVDATLRRAKFLHFARTYKRCGIIMALASGAAASGIAAFAWAANPPDSKAGSRPAVILEPVAVTITLTDSAQTRFAATLGTHCAAKKLDAVAVTQLKNGAIRVATSTTKDCRAAVLDLAPADADITIPSSQG